jgi:tetratricopeptide (TPR) repeat protein
MPRPRRRDPPQASPPQPWLARRRPLVVVLVVLIAAIVRAVYFIQLNASPLVGMQQWDQTDMHYYEAWGRTVANGDWLSATVGPPMHQWQRDVADAYLQAHPDAADRLTREAQAAGAPGVEMYLWKRWMNTPQFYQDPLYMYVIAVIYRVAAEDPRAVIAVQLVLGVCTTLLVWRVTHRAFGDAAAACAAAMALLCAPLVFYEGVLLRDSIVALAGLAIVWMADAVLANATGADRRSIAWAAALGLAGGLAWLLKSTFVALWLVVIAGVVLACRDRRRHAAIVTAATLAGFAIAVAPLALRNTAVGVAPLTLARLGGFTFVASNAAGANPDVGWEIDAPVLASFLGETDGGMRAAVRTTLEAHTPASYARLLWRKWDRTWHWFDIPNNENRYYVQREVPLLAWLPVTFWLVSPLALVGVAIALPRIRAAWPLLLLVVFSAASVVLFVVLARQRVPLIAAAIPFAALTVVEVFRFAARRRYLPALALVAAVVAVGAWTGRPRSAEQFAIRTADWLLPFSIDGEHAAQAAIARQDWAAAAAAYQDFFTRAAPAGADVTGAEDPTLASSLARMHAICAGLRARAGEDPTGEIGEAEGLLQTAAARLAAGGPMQEALRADIAQATSGVGAARQEFASTMSRRAVAEANGGRLTEAIADFRRVAALDSGNSHAHFNLARALAAAGEFTEALSEARRAQALAPADPAPPALVAQLERAQAIHR